MEASGALSALISDNDRLLTLTLLILLYKQGADRTLLLALMYIALF